ncbi:MAG: tripartite tricarboxylate transporter TctB family protein [Thermodesulfobacteriota bacterium]
MQETKRSGFSLPRPQLAGGLVVWGLVGLILHSTSDLAFWAEGSPGPRFMPLVLAVILSLLNLLYWVESAVRPPANDRLPKLEELYRPVCFVAVVILLILLWERLGALLTVILCAVLELRFLERYSWTRTLLVSLVMGGLTIVLFQIILGVALPGGILESLSYLRL